MKFKITDRAGATLAIHEAASKEAASAFAFNHLPGYWTITEEGAAPSAGRAVELREAAQVSPAAAAARAIFEAAVSQGATEAGAVVVVAGRDWTIGRVRALLHEAGVDVAGLPEAQPAANAGTTSLAEAFEGLGMAPALARVAAEGRR